MKKIYDIRCNQLKNPLGIDDSIPSFSWKIFAEINNVFQKAYAVKVWKSDTDEVVWESGMVFSDQSVHITYGGKKLLPKTEYSYEVSVWDNNEEKIKGEIQKFETGFLSQSIWEAKWIGRIPEKSVDEPGVASNEDLGKILLDMMSGSEVNFKPDRKLEHCYTHSKKFFIGNEKVIEKARVYITSLGIYDLKINGKHVSNNRWMPGFTPYDKYVEYQTYDVAEFLNTGENEVAVTLADGWYKGKFGILGFGDNYGSELAALMQLEITFDNRVKQLIITDESFEYTLSLIHI